MKTINKKAIPRRPEVMTEEGFRAALKLFFPDFHATIQDMIDSSRQPVITVCDRYNVDGFDPTYVDFRELKSAGVKRPLNDNDYLFLVTSNCEFYQSSYFNQDTSIRYIDVFKHLSENRIKHEFWFL